MGVRRGGACLLAVAGLWLIATPVRGAEGATAARIAVPFTLEAPGRISAAVYNRDGQLLRTLLRGQPREKGEYTLWWDGLDRAGQPQMPGEYQVKVLRTPGFKAEFLLQLGVRPTSRPYDIWPGNHSGPTALAADATGVYIGCRISEAPPGVIKQSLDGTQRYWMQRIKPSTNGPIALAANGKGTLYWLRSDGDVKLLNATTGAGGEEFFGGGTKVMDWELGLSETAAASTHASGTMDLAAWGDTVVVAYAGEELVRWLEPLTGRTLREVSVATPRSVAVAETGQAFVATGSQVQVFDGAGELLATIGPFENAAHVAVDRGKRHLLVAECGPTHQIHRYTLAGELLSSYGRRGGRRQGLYQPENFLHITDIVADGHGGFLVAEAGPRRVVHVGENGSVLNEWPGPQRFRDLETVDPRDPSSIWYSVGRWLVLARIDYAQKSWTIAESYDLKSLGDGLLTLPDRASSWAVRYHKGKRYLVAASPLPQVLQHQPGSLRCVVAGGAPGDEQRARVAAVKTVEPDSFHSFLWTDLNGDGVMAAEEIALSDYEPGVWPANTVDADFTVVSLRQMVSEGAESFDLCRLPPVRWEGTVPVYDLAAFPGQTWGRSPTGHPANRADAFVGSDGSHYASYCWGQRHGEFFPSDKSGAHNRLTRWTPDGRLAWSIGRHDALTNTRNVFTHKPTGWFHHPYDITGEIRDCIVLNDFMETPGMVWTRDGLYAGDFLDGRIDDGLPGWVYAWWMDRESDLAISLINRDTAHRGAVFAGPAGEVLWIAPGGNSAPIYRIHGWEDWQVQTIPVKVQQAPIHARGQGRGLQGAYYATGSGPANERHGQALEGGVVNPDLGDELTLEEHKVKAVLAAAGVFQQPPLKTGVDRQIWFGTHWKRGGDPVIDGIPSPAVKWEFRARGPGGSTWTHARWTGHVEAPLSEAFRFSTYARGGVRLFLDGRQILFGWNEAKGKRTSDPVELEAGRQYAVQLDFYTTRPKPALSLLWESESMDRVRIPTAYLYPARADAVRVSTRPQVRDACSRIAAETFDTSSAGARWSGFVWEDTVREYVEGIEEKGDYLGYFRLDFGAGVKSLVLAIGGRYEALSVRLGSPNGKTIATADDASNGLQERRCLIQSPTGIHDVYIVNEDGGVVLLRWFEFHR